MSVSFHPDHTVLLAAVSAALAVEDAFAIEVTDLPVMDGFTPPLDRLWIFRFETTVEVHVPASVSYAGPNRNLSGALSSPPVPGGFRLLAAFQASDAALGRAVGHLIEVVQGEAADQAGGAVPGGRGQQEPPRHPEAAGHRRSEPRRPVEALTDLDEVIAGERTAATPDAEHLASTLALTVKGQPRALAIVAEAVVGQLHRVAPRRPAGILLVGPSGVGKTETFEALGEALTDLGGPRGGWSTARIDCNQLKEPHNVADLFGASAGYVGHGQGSPLVQALTADPHTLVLFDEIGQAHPDISVALMGVMDHGFLQLRQAVQGRWQLDCRRAIFLFTTNTGAPAILDRLGHGTRTDHQEEELARQVLVAEGMPEWIAGRHGRVAVYRPLPTATLAEVATLEVRRLAEEFGLDLRWVEPELVGRILAEADVSTTGARALRGAVERLVAPSFVDFRRELARSDRGATSASTSASTSAPSTPDVTVNGLVLPPVVAGGPDPVVRHYEDWLSDDAAWLTGDLDGTAEAPDDPPPADV